MYGTESVFIRSWCFVLACFKSYIIERLKLEYCILHLILSTITLPCMYTSTSSTEYSHVVSVMRRLGGPSTTKCYDVCVVHEESLSHDSQR